jgi:signal transduction histidine kinase/AmiR/NasT family two-component response regulator
MFLCEAILEHSMKLSRIQVLALNLAAFVSYWAGGIVSTGLTRSPEYFTPVWIPAGMVVLFSLVWGYRTVPGILLGSIAFHFYFYQGSVPATLELEWLGKNFDYVPIILIQIWVARKILLNFISEPEFHPDLHTLAKLLLRCAAFGLVLPTLKNLILPIYYGWEGLLPWLSGLGRWWFGDFLGIIALIAVPILIIQRKKRDSIVRVFYYLVPVFTYLLGLVVGYRFIADNEVGSVRERFESDCSQMATQLNTEILDLRNELDQYSILLTQTGSMHPISFEQQSRHIVSDFTFIHDIQWIDWKALDIAATTKATPSNFNPSLFSTGSEDFLTLRYPAFLSSPDGETSKSTKPKGFVQLKFDVARLIEICWLPVATKGLHLKITDHSSGHILAEFSEDQRLDSHAEINFSPPVFSSIKRLSIFDNNWMVTIDADRKYLALYHSSAPFYLLVGGLGMAFLLGVHTLSNYLRTRVIERTVDQQTRELRIAKTEAERLAQAKSEFLAVMSHEIRTPLNGMISTTEMLKTHLEGGNLGELAEIIELSSHTLLALINDILDFSKLEAGKTELESAPFSPGDLLKTVEANFRIKTKDKGVSLKIDLPENTGSQLIGDGNRLLQILMNLASNAVKFTSSGEIRLSMRQQPLDGDSSKLIYKISDTGIGIPVEKQRDLFQPFTQADISSTRRYGGTGLGLAIVKKLTDLMGGSIELQSQPGVGSTFTLTLELPHADETEHLGSTAPTRNQGQFASYPDKKVLLVEDNPQNQKIMLILLRKFELNIDLAEDGLEAIDAARETRYDLIFMDCRLPNMDGYEAASSIRKLEPDGSSVPIVALTASTHEGAREQCIQAGMDDYITKPVTLASVAAALESWLAPGMIDQNRTAPVTEAKNENPG